MALLFSHFWSQFLTDFHKWPFVLKLRTWSFRCTHCHDPTMVTMRPKRDENGAENCCQFWPSVENSYLAKCILRPGWAVFPLLLVASNLVVHRPCWRWHKANNPFLTWIQIPKITWASMGNFLICVWYNLLVVAPQNVPITCTLTDFTLSSWKDFDRALSLIGSKEMMDNLFRMAMSF